MKIDSTRVNDEGFNGMKKLMEYGFKDNEGEEMLGFFAVDRDRGIPEELKTYFKDGWAPITKKHSIAVRGIASRDPDLSHYRDVDSDYNRNVKLVSLEEYAPEVAIFILGKTVTIQDYKNLQGVAIENQDVAKAFKQIFEMVWKRVE